MGLQNWARRTRAALRSDAGLTLVEQLVVVILLGILVGIIAKSTHWATHDAQALPDRQAQWNKTLDASGQLVRDIGHAVTIRTAESQRLVVDTVLDGQCVERDYRVASGKLAVTTHWFGQEDCTGDVANLEKKTETLLTSHTGSTTFSYLTAEGRAITLPATNTRSIKTVSWHLETQLKGLTKPQTLDSAQAFTGRNTVTKNPAPCDAEYAAAPLLNITTTGVGLNRPVLTWSDATSSLTTGWTVWRVTWPTGQPQTNSLTQVAFIADPRTTTWTDNTVTLTPGLSVKYVVQADLNTTCSAASAPLSNAVVTGMRPAAPSSLTAVGRAANIDLSWPEVAGATSYDIYRDGVLFKTGVTGTGATITFTDGVGQDRWGNAIGAGHNHGYKIVAVNRWEQVITGAIEGADLPLGQLDSAKYGGALRAYSSRAVGFTAPIKPDVSASPNTDNSNTVTWTPAPMAGAPVAWVGAGGTPAATLDATWDVQHKQTAEAFTDAFTSTPYATKTKDDTGRTRGDTTLYRARTCNIAGCSVWSATDSSTQRPPNPTSCTVSNVTTRSATVTVNPAAMVSTATGYSVTGGTAAPGYSVAWSGAATSKAKDVDRLADGTTHTFTAKTSNATGASDGTPCSATTPAVQVSVSASASGSGSELQRTKSIVAKVTSTNGTANTPSIKRTSGATPRSGEDSGIGRKCVAGSTTVCTSDDYWYWNPLADNTSYTVSATATDGVNVTSVKTTTASTDELQPPSVSAVATNLGTLQSTRAIKARVIAVTGSRVTPTIDRSGTIKTGESNGNGNRCDANDQCTDTDYWHWDSLVDNTTYTVTAKVTDDFNTASATTTAKTDLLATPALTVESTGTYWVKLSMSASNGSSADSQLGLSGSGWQDGRSTAFYNQKDGTTFTAYAKNGDGFNVSPSDSGPAKTKPLEPAYASCYYSVTDNTAPGSIKVWGGDSVYVDGQGWYSEYHTFSGLGAKTYTNIQAYSEVTDGYNTNKASSGCANVTIKQGKPIAPGCSVVASPSSSNGYLSYGWCQSIGATSYEIELGNYLWQEGHWSYFTYTKNSVEPGGDVTTNDRGDYTQINYADNDAAVVHSRAHNSAGWSDWSSWAKVSWTPPGWVGPRTSWDNF
ncbi:hypothetical protein IC607_08715 [Cellulomonas sp. JH27-2]|uniref:hypothetical protein n=1 Tax=Cellulomonas sp. JH27-2 TaxID=2774139 RepID=UPI0017828217|nr:hypothetical protein [Cellulomonas sp. JH27-2]MBD8059049.1 hypothetical protein [Cellulomonas sp. JH27-2]